MTMPDGLEHEELLSSFAPQPSNPTKVKRESGITMHSGSPGPASPTSNLKVLADAAAKRTSKDAHKFIKSTPVEVIHDGAGPSIPAVHQEHNESVGIIEKIRNISDESIRFKETDGESEMSRKQKSLSVLCGKFLELYPEYPEHNHEPYFGLDQACWVLKTEKRRLYDIINVLWAVDMIKRCGKNVYQYSGKNQIIPCMERLTAYALKEKLRQKVQAAKECKFDLLIPKCDNCSSNMDPDEMAEKGGDGSSTQDCMQVMSTPLYHKSLSIQTQKFLMLLLAAPDKEITLPTAENLLVLQASCRTPASYRTKMRRLYDISNILSAAGLVKRIVVRDSKGEVTAFRYTGPDMSHVDENMNVPPIPHCLRSEHTAPCVKCRQIVDMTLKFDVNFHDFTKRVVSSSGSPGEPQSLEQRSALMRALECERSGQDHTPMKVSTSAVVARHIASVDQTPSHRVVPMSGGARPITVTSTHGGQFKVMGGQSSSQSRSSTNPFVFVRSMPGERRMTPAVLTRVAQPVQMVSQPTRMVENQGGGVVLTPTILAKRPGAASDQMTTIRIIHPDGGMLKTILRNPQTGKQQVIAGDVDGQRKSQVSYIAAGARPVQPVAVKSEAYENHCPNGSTYTADYHGGVTAECAKVTVSGRLNGDGVQVDESVHQQVDKEVVIDGTMSYQSGNDRVTISTAIINQ